MTKTFEAHFDGKSLVPESAIDLPQNQRFIVTVESTDKIGDAARGTAGYFAKHFTNTISNEDADLMRRAIEEADRNFEPSPDINLD